jgi:hypothetical protein
MTGLADAVSRARSLADLFSGDPADGFGTFAPVAAAEVPQPARTLLDHISHMTVAMERFHGAAVDLRVVAEVDLPDGRYAREILLTVPGSGAAPGRVVQHGIVRIDLGCIAPAVAARIRRREQPLGRILVTAGMLCEVHDVALVSILPGPHLARLLSDRRTFGRVASIAVDGRSAIDLLEIVAP